MNFDYNTIVKLRTVVHCKTEEQANQLLEWAYSKGLTWVTGVSFLERNSWNVHKENTCYRLSTGHFGSIKYFREENMVIYSFEEVVLKDTIQKKIVSRKRRVKFLKKSF